VNPSTTYTKTWHIRNVGTCTWTTGYKLAFISGDRMGAPESIAFTEEVLPEHSVNLSVKFVTPGEAGSYESVWMLQSPEGQIFGVGSKADQPIWLKVRVVAPSSVLPSATLPALPTLETTPRPEATATPETIAYDFVTNLCEAEWLNNERSLTCPGVDGDPNGFMLANDQAHLENNLTLEEPTLIMSPSLSADGYIQGIYPEYEVQAGDHFKAVVGCENGYLKCSVLFRVAYVDSTGAINDLWGIGEFYDGNSFNVDLDLSTLAGTKIRLILFVSSLDNAEGDRVLWVGPRIVRSSQPTPSPAPTLTSTPAPTETKLPASSTPTAATALPPTASATATPTPESGGQESSNFFERIIEAIVSFFKNLFGA